LSIFCISIEGELFVNGLTDVSQRGRENGNLDSSARVSHKTSKKVGPVASNEGAASTSGIVSQTASGVLSGSGVLNARPGSATSSGLLSHMVSTLNADVAREYLEKVADLLLKFAQADTTVKSYMCSQSLLSRLFQMFNRVEPPILLKVCKTVSSTSAIFFCFFFSVAVYLTMLSNIAAHHFLDTEVYQSFVNGSKLLRKSSAGRCH
jgi:hypothetical protein